MNMTELTVVDGKLDNEQLGEYTRKCIEGYERIRRGSLKYERVMSQLQLVLEGRGIDFKVSFPAWREIQTGCFKSVEGLINHILEHECKIGIHALGMMNQKEHFKLDRFQKTTQLVKVMLSDIGFTNGATFPEIIARIRELGHGLCSPEVGPQLRWQYTDQPKGEMAFIAMEPFPLDPDTHGGNELAIFELSDSDYLFPQVIDENQVYHDRDGWRWIFYR